MKKLRRGLALVVLLLLHTELSAACNEQSLKGKLKEILPGIPIDNIQNAPMKGWCELSMGAKVFYLEESSFLLFSGELVSLRNGENLSDKRRAELVERILSTGLTREQMLVVPAKNAKTHITVFTDLDCPYCRKFHEEVPKLLSRGLEVRYLFFPRSGLEGPVYEKSVSVWCSNDRVEAIGKAKASLPIKAAKCDNPVSKHYELGRKIGITGTPTIILPNGSRIDGYVPPDELLRILRL